MVRQGLLSRDDAVLRERRAADYRGAYASLDQKCLRRHHDTYARANCSSPRPPQRRLRDSPGRPRRPAISSTVADEAERLVAFLSEVARDPGRHYRTIEFMVEYRRPTQHLECGNNLMDDPAMPAGAEFPRRHRARCWRAVRSWRSRSSHAAGQPSLFWNASSMRWL